MSNKASAIIPNFFIRTTSLRIQSFADIRDIPATRIPEHLYQ